jgi:hypothetical protein
MTVAVGRIATGGDRVEPVAHATGQIIVGQVDAGIDAVKCTRRRQL